MLVALLALTVAIAALPATLMTRLLPPGTTASDFSGGLWHGAAGRLVVNGRDCGAVEWTLHPGALTGLALGIDATWAQGGFALTGSGTLSLHGIAATRIQGGGAIEDIATLTGMGGWHGTATVALDRLDADPGQLRALAGEIRVSGLRNPTIGAGDDLGSYTLHFDPRGAGQDGPITGQLRDDGGPLEVAATLQLDANSRLGTLHGTARERSQASGAVRRSLEQLAQMSPRDGQGRVPLDAEFAY
jgi:hypothetical protein